MARNSAKAVGTLGFLFAFCGLIPNAAGQDKPAPGQTLQLKEVVVTASPIIEGNEVNRYGSQVTTVSKEQISNLNAQDLPSALRRVPGVIISRHNPVGSFGGGEGGAVFIRGQGSSRPGAEIQMLVDGIPKFVSIWTHPLMDVLSVDVIDNVEVYKGAQPVLYGNMAFGAVDIETKRKLDQGFYTSLQGGYGSHNTWVEVLEHGGKVNKWDYYLIQSYRSSDGHRENADGELQNYFGRIGYDLNNHWNLSVILNHTNNWADDPGPADGSRPSDGRFSTKDYFSVATLSNSYHWGAGYLKFYIESGKIDWVDQSGTPGLDTLTDYQNRGIRARETFMLWEGGEMMLGLDLDYIGGEVDVLDPSAPKAHFPEETWRMVAPYLAFSQLIGSKQGFYMIPSAGFRYIDHNQYDNEFAPQAGLILGYKNTQLNTFFSRGVNYPGIYVKVQDELFLPRLNQWQSLNPELVNHYEIGISHQIGEIAKMDLTYFYNDGQDRIVVSPPPPFPPLFKNIGDYTTRGIEGTITLRPLPDLTFFAGFTYLDADPEDLPYSPEWSGSSGVNYRFFERFQISFDGLYVDDQFVTSWARRAGAVSVDKVDSYFLLNGKLTCDFRLPWHGIQSTAYVAGENLTDTDYEQKKGYPMPGLSGMVGVAFRF